MQDSATASSNADFNTRPPLIGLTGRRHSGKLVKDFAKPLQGCLIDTYITDYPAAITAAGGLPVLLTPDSEIAPLLERLDGVLLTGGADIEPRRYGAEVDPKCGPVEPERDEFELAIYEEATALQMPMLGICRGLQLVNVAAGGTLHQHLPNHTTNGQPAFTDRHEIKIEPGSTMASLYQTEQRGVNSLHHQAVDRVAEDFVVTARSDDGYIESLEHQDLPIVAVQWHPELLPEAKQDPVFSWLVNAARMRMAAQASIAA